MNANPSLSANSSPADRLLGLWQAMRPAQWTKNAIVLAPFLFALGDRQAAVSFRLAVAGRVVGAAFLFCLVSSGVYLMNDLRDLEADRFHPIKKRRPLPAGRITPLQAALWSGLLLLAGVTGGVYLDPLFGGLLLAYLALQAVYTFLLKQVALVDVMVIAAGFVLRAVGGAVAAGVRISPWLLLCTYLLALFLALCKRRHEKLLLLEEAAENHREALLQYHADLMDQLIAVTAACTILSYSLYTLWPDTVAKYRSHALGVTIPFVIFGIFRYLDLVYRHGEGGRPEKLLLTDGPLLASVLLFGLTALAVILL
mgnify:CR=1 FL=1